MARVLSACRGAASPRGSSARPGRDRSEFPTHCLLQRSGGAGQPATAPFPAEADLGGFSLVLVRLTPAGATSQPTAWLNRGWRGRFQQVLFFFNQTQCLEPAKAPSHTEPWCKRVLCVSLRQQDPEVLAPSSPLTRAGASRAASVRVQSRRSRCKAPALLRAKDAAFQRPASRSPRVTCAFS